ncbi:hypothetical protein [Massilia sp. DD77]|uniref:hypothetical protein n=1 Tax=Massilia sp. DD77 TaxID=3109349 RepID=UPI003FA58E65
MRIAFVKAGRCRPSAGLRRWYEKQVWMIQLDLGGNAPNGPILDALDSEAQLMSKLGWTAKLFDEFFVVLHVPAKSVLV